jgi:NTE family protein
LEKTRVFCVFEGGGAKGVAHVGFLKAIQNQPEYDVSGYAGTSAGAIIAALAAVGWTGRELYDEVEGQPSSKALDALKRFKNIKVDTLADLIAPDDWRKIKNLKGILVNANAPSRSDRRVKEVDIGLSLRRKLVGLMLVFCILSFFVAMLLLFTPIPVVVWLTIQSFVLAMTLLFVAYVVGKYRGFASMSQPQEFLEALLQAKVPEHSERGVTFADLRGVTLKVVAANLETGQLEMFSDETPHVLVSEAVAASAAIPLVFKPVEIDGVAYCDGGIVSNLPAWTFDRERLLDERCLVITCEIAPPRDRPPRRPMLSGLRLLTRIGVTAVFGGAGLNTRGMLWHLKLESWASFSVLDFEKAEEQIALINDTEKYAELEVELERKHKASIAAVARMASEMCDRHQMDESDLRVSYARYLSLVGSRPAAFHLWNCHGFEGHHDEHLVLPVRDALIFDAVDSRESKFFDLSVRANRERYLGMGSQGFPTKRIPTDRTWVAIVPLVRRVRHSRVSAAVCFDGVGRVPANVDTFLSDLEDIVAENV